LTERQPGSPQADTTVLLRDGQSFYAGHKRTATAGARLGRGADPGALFRSSARMKPIWYRGTRLVSLRARASLAAGYLRAVQRVELFMLGMLETTGR
jgi:hypothetical protein